MIIVRASTQKDVKSRLGSYDLELFSFYLTSTICKMVSIHIEQGCHKD